MSRSSERERARLDKIERARSTDVSSGLTYAGGHEEHVISADSDEAERIKAGIVFGDGVSRDIASGLTYGDPRDNAVRIDRENEWLRHGNALLDRERADADELAMRREMDLLEGAVETINGAALFGWQDAAATGRAARVWEALTPVQRASLVADGGIDEDVADDLHQRVWPAVAQSAVEHKAQVTQAAGQMQKALSLMLIRQERGLEGNDAAWQAHTRRVFAAARDRGVDLDKLGAQEFEDAVRAFEIIESEDQRAQAVAEFQADVLNAPSTDISQGLRVMNGGAWTDYVPREGIEVRPDYKRAGERVLGGRGEGDPAFDRPEEIIAGIMAPSAPSETAEWRHVQTQAGEMFSAAEEARIRAKLGER